MTITKYDGVAILPKRCDKCNRLFWLESYNIFYKTVGTESHSLKQIECKNCMGKIQNILYLPGRTKERKTGHWILQPSNKEQGEIDFIWWKCSECGQVIYSDTEKDRREYHAFCGRCGTKMVEPQERSEV